MQVSLAPRRLWSFLCVGSLLVAAGCGGPKLVSVNGTAKLDGKPLAGFLLTFNPDAGKGVENRMNCAARIGDDGQFSVQTDEGGKQSKGAPPGRYKVTISSPD